MELVYIAGGFAVLAVLIGAFLFHRLAKRRESNSLRNKEIDSHIDTITKEIQRIDTEKYQSPHPVGSVAVVESILPQINKLGIDVGDHWETFYDNEYRRKSREGEKKPLAIEALHRIVGVLSESKT